MPAAVPLLDLNRQYQALKPELDEAVLSVMQSGYYILGPNVKAFEAEMAAYCSSAYGIGVANGSDAIYLALRALDIGPGDEVITTCMSYIATSESIVRAGAKPVFVDLTPEGTFNLDVNQIESVITPRTRAIIPVHLYGQAVDMDALMQVANQHGLAVIEDCAQAVGATWNGKKVGSFGDMGTFSFFPTKNLGAAGDGGLITTSNPELDARLRQLRVHGAKTRYDHTLQGINSRLDELQAAILRVKLPYIDTWNTIRRAIAARYTDAFSGIEGLITPVTDSRAKPVFHQYTLRVLNGQRDALREALQERGVPSMIYYPIPLHQQGMHSDLGYELGRLPIGEEVAGDVLSLPIFADLQAEEVDQVCQAVKEVMNTLSPVSV